jgi:hypothetical protein
MINAAKSITEQHHILSIFLLLPRLLEHLFLTLFGLEFFPKNHISIMMLIISNLPLEQKGRKAKLISA